MILSREGRDEAMKVGTLGLCSWVGLGWVGLESFAFFMLKSYARKSKGVFYFIFLQRVQYSTVFHALSLVIHSSPTTSGYFFIISLSKSKVCR